jgi:hypothetical protein
MPPWLKKGLWIALAIFVLFFLITQPELAATILKGIGRGVVSVIGGIASFFQALAS